MARRGPPRREDLTRAEVQIEGRRPVLEALRADRPIRRLLVARTSAPQGTLSRVLAEARRRGIPIQHVDETVLDRLARTRAPQGVLAVAMAHATVDLDAILARARDRAEPAFLLLLDGVEDPANLGAILRSAEAAGVHGVVIPSRRAAGLSPAVAASSAGAIEHVPVAQVVNLAQTLARLQRDGIWVIGADPGSATDLYDVPLRPPVALVVGGEGRGLSRLVRERCDRLVRIPMHGATASLNVSVAAALVLFEVRRQMRQAARPAS